MLSGGCWESVGLTHLLTRLLGGLMWKQQLGLCPPCLAAPSGLSDPSDPLRALVLGTQQSSGGLLRWKSRW